MKKICLYCLLPVISFAFASSANAGIHAYAELGIQINKAVVEIQQKHGMPVKYGYAGNHWLAVDGRPGHYTIIFYRAKEVPQAVILDTIKYCIDLYEKQGLIEELVSIEVLLYKESGDEWRESRVLFGIISEAEPYFIMKIGKDE